MAAAREELMGYFDSPEVFAHFGSFSCLTEGEASQSLPDKRKSLRKLPSTLLRHPLFPTWILLSLNNAQVYFPSPAAHASVHTALSSIPESLQAVSTRPLAESQTSHPEIKAPAQIPAGCSEDWSCGNEPQPAFSRREEDPGAFWMEK